MGHAQHGAVQYGAGRTGHHQSSYHKHDLGSDGKPVVCQMDKSGKRCTTHTYPDWKVDDPQFCRMVDGVCLTPWHIHEGKRLADVVAADVVADIKADLGPTGTGIRTAPVFEPNPEDGVWEASCGECGEPLDDSNQGSGICGWCGVIVDWENATEEDGGYGYDSSVPEVLHGVVASDGMRSYRDSKEKT